MLTEIQNTAMTIILWCSAIVLVVCVTMVIITLYDYIKSRISRY